MKHLLWLFLTVSLAVRAIGQSNAPVRLAVIVDSEEVASPGNVLTFELSRNPQVVLLERSEIQKVYREQGLSAENKNYVKLGQMLRADGLCLLEIIRTGMQTNLSMRVVAVKPGVVLANENFAWPIDDVLDWAASTADHLKPLFPKLNVMVKDAIPLSVVNLRSAVASKEATEMERQLKLLTIQRLSHEPQFFVLERQKMQLLSDEKSLKGIDDSAFWSGSYLLEGVLDQNGYSENTVTINARLTPAKGGAPLLFEVEGSRTNLAEVVNLLALKISELLNANSMGSEWNPGDEAAQYFAEANWALRWGILSEAQMASDSAWALGKQDLECASARIKAYLPEVTSGMYDFAHSSYLVDGRRDVAGAMRRVTDELHQQYAAFVFNIHDTTLDSVGLVKPPPPESIDRPIKTLALYEDLSHALADQLRSTNGAAVAAAGTWHALGVADLTAAAKVLQRFQFVPGSEKPVAEKLAELRAEARAVDRLISDDYCDVQWGCFWQETPEECLSLYHHLLANPDFWRIHDEFWIRQPEQPRLTAWNAEDRTRIPELWNHFVQDLNESTNVLWRMEAQVLTFADASDKIAKDTAFTNLVNLVSEHREELRKNPSRPFSSNWGFNVLFLKYSSYYEFYEANLRPQLSSIDLDYHTKTVPEMTEAALFQEQKQYLAANAILEHSNYIRLFFAEKFSKAQALELQPLAAAYKSNLVAQSQVSVAAWTKLQLALSDAFSLAYDINHTIDPSLSPRLRWEGSPLRPGGRPVLAPSTNRATASHLTTTPSVETLDVIQKPVRVARETNSETAAETNVIVVKKFVELPLTGPQGEHRSFLKITSHQLVEGKLLLDFTYSSDAAIPANDPAELRTYEQPSGIAIFDPATEHLDSISCPRFDVAMANSFHYCTTLFRGEVYHSDGARISRYDRKTQKWEVLPISNGINYELFNVADHLYAADDSTIFEIVDSGKSTRLLCSTRRNPPVTLLDRQNLGTPILTEGPNHSLRVIGKDKTFILANNDWVQEGKAPQHSWTPQIFPEGVLFRYHPGGLGQPDHLSYLAVATNSPELLLLQQGRVQKNLVYNPDQYKRINAALIQAPLWSRPKGLALENCQQPLRIPICISWQIIPKARKWQTARTCFKGIKYRQKIIITLPYFIFHRIHLSLKRYY